MEYSVSLVFLASVSISQAALFTWEEFRNSIVNCGYDSPNRDQYNAFSSRITKDGAIETKTEAAIFLAQILWESGGLKYKRELRCINTGCPGIYDDSLGFKGQNYFGRGYIQLTHSYNYKAASQALYGDDRLLRNADLVAQSEDAACGTAFWYWKANVHNVPGVKLEHFGSATNAIDGDWECRGKDNELKDAGRGRYEFYKKIRKAAGLKGDGIETGCYN